MGPRPELTQVPAHRGPGEKPFPPVASCLLRSRGTEPKVTGQFGVEVDAHQTRLEAVKWEAAEPLARRPSALRRGRTMTPDARLTRGW